MKLDPLTLSRPARMLIWQRIRELASVYAETTYAPIVKELQEELVRLRKQYRDEDSGTEQRL